MKPKKAFISILTIALLVLLVLVAGVLTLLGGTRALGIDSGRGGPAGRGQFQGNTPPDGMVPLDNQNFLPGSGNGNIPPGMNGGSFEGNGNFNLNSTQATQIQTRIKLLLLAQYSVGGSVLLFGILAIIGLWFTKKWGKVLTVLTGVIVLSYTIPSLFNIRGGTSLIEAIIKLVLAVAVIVLVFLLQKKVPVEVAAPESPAT